MGEKDKPDKRDKVLFSKVYGCLIGGAVGDAFGGPLEDMHHEAIKTKYGVVKDLLEYACPGMGPDQGTAAGLYTDDTKMKHIICKAIIRHNGRVTADEVAEVLVETDPEGL